ncbi:MAG TPA: ATP-binding protein [Oligoflexus sp.]|uniref:ATP-binding protein n=1 Tax=Oligoflexus sp. TaxID=1971216 RepID=UPI002D6223A5|nr:ATP-binding protein [Oligoflexus sp.]HYX37449.1 ATP-binding protein [Oligoflexus sp.]
MRALFLIFLLCLPTSLTAAVIREAVQGEVDLRDWDGKEALRIYGDWRFFPKKLLTPEQIPQSLSETEAYFLKPGQPFRALQGHNLDNQGFGTYLMRVQSPCQRCRIYFAQPQLYVAGKIFVFDATTPSHALPIFELGSVATEFSQEKPLIGTILTPNFEVRDETSFYILIQVSNFHFYWGGLWQPPALYKVDDGFPRAELLSAVFLFGVMLFCTVHSISLFLRRREDKSTRELAIFSAIMLFRGALFATGGRFLLIHSNWGWELLWDLIYMTLALAAVWFYRFTAACFPEQASARIGRAAWIIALGLGGMFLATGMVHSEYLVMVLYAYASLCALPTVWILIQAALQKKEGSLIALLGFISLTISGLSSLLWFLGNTSFSPMGFEIGTAFFMICQTQIVAKRSASAFRRAEQLSKELVEKDRARTLFFHNTSHELRTPLHGILGFLSLISKGQYGPISDRLRLQVLKVTRLTESLKDQVNTILDLAKSKRGELNLHVQKFPLGEMVGRVQDCIDGLRLKYPHVQFIQHNQIDHDQIFLHDAEKLITILRNLLSNAFKFARGDAVNQVSLLMQTDAEGLYFEVTDTGIGIPADKTQYIFKEFSQLQGDARRSYEGTGLGLSIVHDLLELMHGRVEVQSVPGQGSTFRVWIGEQKVAIDPRSQEPSVMASPASPSPASEALDNLPELKNSATSLPDPSRFTILVVDDNELNCEVVQELLQMDGYRVMIATGGKDGIHQIEVLHPHLVLLDLMMPDVSGEDVMKYVKNQDRLRDIPVILITARATEEDKLMGLELGADDYLAKPLVPDELRLRVRNILVRYDDNRRLARQEYQDRMSQLGEVVGDLAREWHSIHQTIAEDMRQPEERVQRVGRLLPLPSMQRDLLVRLLYQKGEVQPVENLLDSMGPPSPEHPAAHELQYLRTVISQLTLSSEQARGLWRSIGQLQVDEIQQLGEMIHLCQSYLHLTEAARHSRELMESILAFSRHEMDEHIIDLKQTVERTYHLLRMRAGRLGIQMRMDLEPITVFSVTSYVQHILLCLLNNAMDAVADLPGDERWIAVALAIDPQTKQVLIRVSNGGRPLEAHVQEHLFERGFTTKGETAKGIGLFISRRLARQLHGELIHRRDAGHTTFILILPPGHQVALAI